MKTSKPFTFDTPIINKGKLLGYATVSGIGYWDTENTEYDRCYADCRIDTVYIGNQDVTDAFRVCRVLGDTFAEIIENAAYAHIELLFFPPYESPYQVIAIAGSAEQLINDKP